MKPSYQLIICDSESGYAEKLADYLRRSRECSFDIRVYTDSVVFLEKEAGQKAELLLIDEHMYEKLTADKELEHICAEKLLILTEEKSVDIAAGVCEETIYKYQAGSGILYHLLDYHRKVPNSSKIHMMQRQAEVIGIYSPIKRTLKTSFAITLGQILAEQEETLYISLEGCSGLEKLLSLQADKNLADLVYEFSVKVKQFPLLLYQFVQQIEGLAMIPPVETIAELQCVKSQEWIELLQHIAENSCYKKLILDIGDSANGIMDILQLCDTIYLPIRSDYISTVKISAFESSLKKHDEGKFLVEKIRRLEFPYFEELGEDYTNLKYSALGSFVRELLGREEASSDI